MHKIVDREMVTNPNVVKVVTDNKGYALYFSRSPLPYARNTDSPFTYYRHIGVYGYRKQALMQFVKWPVSPLENTEKLEQLRYLENGVRIKMVKTEFEAVGIDTQEDLARAQQYLNKNNPSK